MVRRVETDDPALAPVGPCGMASFPVRIYTPAQTLIFHETVFCFDCGRGIIFGKLVQSQIIYFSPETH